MPNTTRDRDRHPRTEAEEGGRRPGTIVGKQGPPRQAWQANYVRRILWGDALCALAGAVVGYLVRFGPDTDPGSVEYPSLPVWLAAALPLLWVLAMTVARTYEPRFLWVGAEEYHRVFNSAAFLLATVGTVSWAFKLEIARGFIVVALPVTTVLTLLQRYEQRRWLSHQRSRGRFTQSLLLVGHRNGVESLGTQLRLEPYHGYRAIGCCLPAPQVSRRETVPAADAETAPEAGVAGPVLGDLDDVIEVVRRFEVDTVAVLPCPEFDGPKLRRLGWNLEKTTAELLLAPAITEIAGPRVCIRPVCGLPLLHVERPELRGVRRLTKEVFDRAGAALCLLPFLPILGAIALAIRLTTRGPVLYRQERAGRDGQPFSMLKIRTMVVGADRMLEDLAAANEGNGVLFKIRDDPRVTPIGRLLRRYSLDELPQLINVLIGDMSLVGPRPPLPSEVDRYGFDMHRRFLVKPGITGLWQVSGRSDLSWDDSVRIDVRYVENWSLAFDLMILWKTLGAVRRASGAY